MLYERQSALANLKFYGQVLYSLPTMSATDALVQVGLSDQAQKPASKLTPSSQRRLAFARVLMGLLRFLLLHPVKRTRTGDRLDATYTCRDSGFGDDFEEADVAGALHV